MEKYKDGTNPWGHYLESALQGGGGDTNGSSPTSLVPGTPLASAYAPFRTLQGGQCQRRFLDLAVLGPGSRGAVAATAARAGGAIATGGGRTGSRRRVYSNYKDDPLYKTRMCWVAQRGEMYLWRRLQLCPL